MRAQQTYALAALIVQSISAFAPPQIGRSSDVTFSPLSAGPPIISNWRYESSSGTISGIVTNHPTIPDGDRITTSQVKNPRGINENLIVETKSGSKYKLSNVASIFSALEISNEMTVAKNARAVAEIKAKVAPSKNQVEQKKPKASITTDNLSPRSVTSSAALRKLSKSKFSLTGTTVGADGKYLLAAKPRQSSGRSAKIWTAYLRDPNVPDVPAGFDGGDSSHVQQLTIKLSPDNERLQLENYNYNKVQSGLFSGRFVKKIEYLDTVSSNDRNLDGKVSALVIESGQCDLKTLLSARKGMPLRGRALRDAAVAAGQCIQAVHSSNSVWTDLKTENFVLVNSDVFKKEVSDINGSMGMPGVKGIDLESVVAKGGNPIDYTPEASPPEFSKALMGGYGEDFVLDYSYDMWSLGMMLYELSTGTAYFYKKSPSIVTKLLCADTFEVDVSKVPDVKLRDLIGKCLSLDPRKRPDITGFLLHPYFLTSGIGPISF